MKNEELNTRRQLVASKLRAKTDGSQLRCCGATLRRATFGRWAASEPRIMDKSVFPEPDIERLMSALATLSLGLSADTVTAVRARLHSLLFGRHGWWWAWKHSAMSGLELRNALLQHTHLTIEDLAKRKIPVGQFATLRTSFELALFCTLLAGEEPAGVKENDDDA